MELETSINSKIADAANNLIVRECEGGDLDYLPTHFTLDTYSKEVRILISLLKKKRSLLNGPQTPG